MDYEEMRRLMHEKQYPNQPSSARIYDYFLGGSNWFPVDERAAEHLKQRFPESSYFAHMNRDYLRRVVSWLVRTAGISQFLDLGSGIPTMDNVHEVAKRYNPASRVVYVDNDPLAVSESLNLLESVETTTAILADLRDTDGVLNHTETRRILDFSQPIAVLFVSILHFFPDDAMVQQVISTYRDATVTGSYLAVSHGSAEEYVSTSEEKANNIEYMKQAYPEFTVRSPTELQALFAGYTLIEPGVVPLLDWHPDDETPEHQMYNHLMYGGVGRKV